MSEQTYDKDTSKYSPQSIINQEKQSPDKKSVLSSSAESSTALSQAEKLGKGYSAPVNKSISKSKNILGTIFQGAKNHPKTVGIGMVGGILGTIVLIGAFFLATYKLTSIASTLLRYESKIERRVEDKVAQKIFQKIIDKVKTKNNPQQEEEAKTAEAEGETITSDIETFNITDPQIIEDLAKAGVTVELDNAGNFVGLKNASGQDITEEVATNEELFNNIAENLPEWDAGQVTLFRNLMTDHAGSTFDPIPPDTPEDKVQQTFEDDVAGTEAPSSSLTPQESDKEPSANDTNPQDALSAAQGTDVGGQVGAAVNAASQAAESGASTPSALAKGVSTLKGAFTDPIFLAGFASMLCSVEKSVAKASSHRVPTISDLLIRHATSLLSVADEQKSGALSSGQAGKIAQIFSGDSSIKPTKSDPRPEASLPFNDSATWQEATGGTVNTNPKSSSYTPGIQSSALPTENAGSHIVNEINTLLKFSGGEITCKVLTSPFGFIAQTFAGIIQIAGDIGSFGTSQAVFSAAIISGQQFVNNVVLPDLLEYFTPIGLNGGEDAVQWLNNSGAGMNLAFNDYARRLGAEPVANTEANQQFAEATSADNLANQQESLSNRLFAFSNPNSLFSKLAIDLPIGFDASITHFSRIFLQLPTIVIHDFATIFAGKFTFAQSPIVNPGQGYDITQYTFTNNELNNWYDPISNEQYLFSNVSADGKSIERINALGNPNTYVESQTGDTNYNDLLHCFVDSYTILQTVPGANNNCGDIGIYDSAQQPYNNLPTNQTVVNIYCNALGNPSNCSSIVQPQINNDLERFRQYLIDLQVVKNYVSLTNNK